MPRLLNRLGNAKQVAALKEPGWHGDGGGLYLRIKPTGTRSWVLVSTKGGKRVERGLGSAASVTLAQAREMRDNPPTKETASAPLFGDWADEIVKELLPGFKNEKHRQQWENTLKTHAAPLRRIRVDEIDTDDVLDVLRPIWSTVPETASRLRGRIERILAAARAKGLIEDPWSNPAAWRHHLEHFLPRRKKLQKKHHPAMPFADVPAFVAELRTASDASAAALEFLILCASRTGEVIGAKVREFDLRRGLWTVPAERMKMGVEHIVPLSPRALAIAKQWAEHMRPDDFLFPGGRKGKGLSNMALLEKLRGMRPGLTVHGFRSSFRDWAGDATDYPRELAEMALAHAVGDAVEQAYRRSTALEKRRALMTDWAAFVDGAEAERAKAA